MKFPSDFYDACLRYAKYGEIDDSLTAYQRRAIKKLNLEEENDVLYLNNLPVVREEEKMDILNNIYTDAKQGLCGYHLLYNRIKDQYANISRLDVQKFLKSNRSHQQWLVPKKKRVVVRPILTKQPKERFVVDIFHMNNNPDMNDGYKYILLCVDHYSGYLWGFPLETKNAFEVFKHLEKLLTEHKPSVLSSDNGKEFVYHKLVSFCEENNITKVLSSPYHPQSQGSIERMNGIVKRKLFEFFEIQNSERWVEALQDVIYNLNTSKRRFGYSPEEIFNGKATITTKMKKEKRKWVQREKAEFDVGDFVRVIISAKESFKDFYKSQFSTDIFEVISRSKHKQPVYILKNTRTNQVLTKQFFNRDMIHSGSPEDEIINEIQHPKKQLSPQRVDVPLLVENPKRKGRKIIPFDDKEGRKSRRKVVLDKDFDYN